MRKLFLIPLLCAMAFGQANTAVLGGNARLGGVAGLGTALSNAFSPTNTKNCYGFNTGSVQTINTGVGSGAVACSSIAAGSSIWAVACSGFGNNPTAFSDAQGDTFSTFLLGTGRYCIVGYVASSLGGAGEVTANGMAGADQPVVAVTVWTGLTALDKQTFANTGASPVSSGSTSTTAFANELLIGAIYGRSGTITPVGTGTFVGATTIYNLNLAAGNLNLSIQWITVSSTGAYAYTATVGNSTDETYVGTWH